MAGASAHLARYDRDPEAPVEPAKPAAAASGARRRSSGSVLGIPIATVGGISVWPKFASTIY